MPWTTLELRKPCNCIHPKGDVDADVSSESSAFQSIFHPDFVANMVRTGQTNEAKIATLLASGRPLRDGQGTHRRS